MCPILNTLLVGQRQISPQHISTAVMYVNCEVQSVQLISFDNAHYYPQRDLVFYIL